MPNSAYAKVGEVLTFGASVGESELAILLLHGRGQSAQSILSWATRIGLNEVHWLVPQSPIFHWYGGAYNAPIVENAAEIHRAQQWFDEILDEVSQTMRKQNIMVVGFSQGACMALQYAWQCPKQIDTVVALTGSLIGESVPSLTGRESENHIGLEVFLRCPQQDIWVNEQSVRESATAFREAGANVSLQITPATPHILDHYDAAFLGGIISAVLER